MASFAFLIRTTLSVHLASFMQRAS